MIKSVVLILIIVISIIVINVNGSITRPSLVIRVCDGPSCSSQGSDQLFEAFCRSQEKYVKEIGDVSDEDMSIGTIKCLNACKRSCNVAIVPRGRATGIQMSDMNQVERTKPAYCKVRTEEQVDKIVNTVASFIKNYNGERY